MQRPRTSALRRSWGHGSVGRGGGDAADAPAKAFSPGPLKVSNDYYPSLLSWLRGIVALSKGPRVPAGALMEAYRVPALVPQQLEP